MKNVSLRPALASDVSEICRLYRETVTAINIRDYTPEQVAVWAAAADDEQKWMRLLGEQRFIIAESGGIITGFISLARGEYIDFLYIHKDYQRRGIARALLADIEELAVQSGARTLGTDASITARPFFERHGFRALRENNKIFNGVEFINYYMEKTLLHFGQEK